MSTHSDNYIMAYEGLAAKGCELQMYLRILKHKQLECQNGCDHSGDHLDKEIILVSRNFILK